MKISKILIDEIFKLNKVEWEALKTNIDCLFSIEERRRNKELYIQNESSENIFRNCPHLLEVEEQKETIEKVWSLKRKW